MDFNQQRGSSCKSRPYLLEGGSQGLKGATLNTIYQERVSAQNAGTTTTYTDEKGTYNIPASEVTDFLKLYFLPNTSGKPVPGSYGSPVFFNTDRTAYYNQPVGDLESISGVTYVISGDTIYSFESVADANQMADDKLSSILSIGQVQNYGVNPKYTEYGIINAFFTHELKIETTPTNILCYYDKRIYVEPITGTTFYYDIKGWTKSFIY